MVDDLRTLIRTKESLLDGDVIVELNNQILSGANRDQTIANAISNLDVQIRFLQFSIGDLIFPDEYVSFVTGTTHYPTEEDKKKYKPLPPSKHTFFCVKQSRKNYGDPNSKFILTEDGKKICFDFFIQHDPDKKYPNGTFAKKVKKGSISVENFKPAFAIKVFNNDNIENSAHQLRLAMRSAYLYRMLGRTGYSFRRNNKQYLVSDWCKGVNLYDADQSDVRSIPIPRRIVMAISLLNELSILHSLGLVHCDIKPGNVMINFGELYFVDLDSVRLENDIFEQHPLMCTHEYLMTAQMKFDAIHNPLNLRKKLNYKTDIYALGLTLAYMFQEIYIPHEESITANVIGGSSESFTYPIISLIHGPEYDKHQSLQKLLKSMVFQSESGLSTCREYTNALLEIVKEYPDHEKYLNEIRLPNHADNITKEDGEKAFGEIEKEIFEYNTRLNRLVTPRP